MEKDKIKYLSITIGALLMAVAVLWYFEPIGIVTGGVTGLAVIAKYLWDIPVWATNGLINIPLFIAGYKLLDKRTFIRTFYATLLLTIMLGVMPKVNLRTGDYIADVITGSVIMGSGLGIIFLSYTSSGGSDLLAQLINLKVKYMAIPQIMAIIDSVIVALGISVFGIKKGVYSVIAIFVIERMSNSLLEGPKKAKQMCIITNNKIAISDYIIHTIYRGVTVFEATGGYSGEKKNVLICVVSSREMIKIRQKIAQIDKNAICFIGDIREAFGEGFTKNW